MRKLTDYFRGTITLELTSADLQRWFRVLKQERVPFWKVHEVGPLTIQMDIYRKDLERFQRLAAEQNIQIDLLSHWDFRWTFRGFRKRIVFLVCFLLFLMAAYILPQFVWTVTIEGNSTIPSAKIERALNDLGIGFGTYGKTVDNQKIKNQMLAMIPELQWIAVNCSGGRANVLVAERPEKPKITDDTTVTNVIATKTGILTELSVLNGQAVVKAGETVLAGQVLVSGYIDCTTHTQTCHAMAEIYAMTWNRNESCLPVEYYQKVYTGKEETCIYLQIGRKRIKIFGKSGNCNANCDKIIKRQPLTLPGEVTFPVSLITETSREYALEKCIRAEDAAQEMLSEAAIAAVKEDMIAGVIRDMKQTLSRKNGAYYLSSEFACTEMIAQEQVSDIFVKEEENND